MGQILAAASAPNATSAANVALSRQGRALVWLRRDLRCHDHAALHQALSRHAQVWVAFVFDRNILDPLPRRDRRVEFIRESLLQVDAGLRQLGGDRPGVGLIVRHGFAREEIVGLAHALAVDAVYASHDDEPTALARDAGVREALAATGIALHTMKDHVVFERQEVLTQAGQAFTVFTPYKNAWLRKVNESYLSAWPVAPFADALAKVPEGLRQPVPSLADMGFEQSNLAQLGVQPGMQGGQALFEDFLERMDRYDEQRDFPAIKGPSYLSVHLRFGTVSIRELARAAHARMTQGSAGAQVWLSELIWRDFYAQILANFPHAAHSSFKPAYEAIQWESGDEAQALLAAWCEGRTGYPLIDAAMAQINHSGYMHNRLRMVVASFLVKDLGLDWRWGERYFAEQLIDFDLSANNGGWQWAASSGCDAQPYFRIFNPSSQSEKFDAQGKFIRRYLPQLSALPDSALHAPWLARPVDLTASDLRLGTDYPLPIVDHAQARERTLARYAVVKKSAQ